MRVAALVLVAAAALVLVSVVGGAGGSADDGRDYDQRLLAASSATGGPPEPTLQAQSTRVPPAGGMTLATAGTDDPTRLVDSLPFRAGSVAAFDIHAQRFLTFIPGATPLVNAAFAEHVRADTILWIRRHPGDSGPAATDTVGPALPVVGGAQALPPPRRGGLTVGTAGTHVVDDLIAAQLFSVASVLLFDVDEQRFLSYVPGAPSHVDSLAAAGVLRSDSIVWLRRSEHDAPIRLGPTSAPSPRLAAAGSLRPGTFVDPDASIAPAPPTSPASGQVTVEYTASTEDFVNPERGWFAILNSGTISSGYRGLTAGNLSHYRTDGRTLIKRYFMLTDYVDRDIAPQYLAAVGSDFRAAREAGMKLIVRFSYTNDPNAGTRDASRAQVLRHIDQLAPVLHANRDVIAVVQAGFIGVWGEWAFTDHFSDPYASDFGDRQEVLVRLLQAVPSDRYVQVRAPRYKYRMSLNPGQAARVAFHNDCFLASDTDAGTYLEEALSFEREYLARETRNGPMGGETCRAPSSRYSRGLAELDLFNWSYLNRDFHEAHVAAWRNDGQLETISRSLGYRLELVRGTYPKSVSPGGALPVSITLRNTGWAAPYNPRHVELILRHTSTGAEHRLSLSADPRRWFSGSTVTVQEQLTLPGNLPAGVYDLLINLPDPAPTLRNRTEYSIRLANEGVWEPSTGSNRLQHQVTVR